ncbi:MAG TPA: redoxin domain-containing protein, partial [Candidatus Limnocylindrales bacterium]|nr:redoxin domain-containing protein [Candidatus Limnocylindrales bacterium]
MIEEGSPAPDFTLRDQNNQEVRLSSFQGSRNVLLVFYPFAFTGTCQGELQAIRDNPFNAATVQVLTVSVDTIYSHKIWAEREGFDFPLLADFWPHGEVAQA